MAHKGCTVCYCSAPSCRLASCLALPTAGFTCPGDVIITDHKHASHAPASEAEPELARMYLAELNSRGREVAPALSGSSMMFYQVWAGFGVDAGHVQLLYANIKSEK